MPFAVDPVWRMKLLNGWDDIDLTLNQADAIHAQGGGFIAAAMGGARLAR